MSSPCPFTLGLESVLRDERCFETEAGLLKRREVLKNLNLLVKQWIQSVSLSRGMHWQDIDKIGGRIVTYGSYMLGISHQGADIDALCIAPQHITRNEYFSSFLSLLSYQSEVSELRAIEEAYVPVLKMRFDGIEIDMTFAKLNVAEVPGELDFSGDESLLLNLEPKCMRSLNGYRSTQELLRLVPNKETFQLTLRAVKLWAKGQGLYSNILGFLGGFSWAVLVAKACILNKDSSPAETVLKFFSLFSTWPWPEPVELTDYRTVPKWVLDQATANAHGQSHLLQQQQPQHFGGAPHQMNTSTAAHLSWNPDRNPQDTLHVMPVITPTYPHINSTFNVSPSSLKLIQDKMRSAEKVCQRIFNGEEKWVNLFKTNHIFPEYHHFLVVIASANNYIQWFGLIESKIRHFLISIEKECCQTLQSVRIWPKPFTKRGDEKQSLTRQLWFVGLEYLPMANHNNPVIDISRPLRSFVELLHRDAGSFFSPDMKINAHCVRKTDLTGHLTQMEIDEIVSSQSQKRESTPPPKPQAPPPPSSGGVSTYNAATAAAVAAATATAQQLHAAKQQFSKQQQQQQPQQQQHPASEKEVLTEEKVDGEKGEEEMKKLQQMTEEDNSSSKDEDGKEKAKKKGNPQLILSSSTTTGVTSGVLSSPSYAAAVTQTSSKSRKEESKQQSSGGNKDFQPDPFRSCVGSGPFTSSSTLTYQHQQLPKIPLPSMLSLSSFPPPSLQQQQQPASSQHQQHRGGYGSGGNGSPNGYHHHHPHHSHHQHHHNHHHNGYHHYQAAHYLRGPPPHSPIMERTWNTRGSSRSLKPLLSPSPQLIASPPPPPQSSPHAANKPPQLFGNVPRICVVAKAADDSGSLCGGGGGGQRSSQKPTTSSSSSDKKSSNRDFDQTAAFSSVNINDNNGGNGDGNVSKKALLSTGSSASNCIFDESYGSLDSESGRSISFSSDKFPPRSLINARLHHQVDRVPFSPLSVTPPCNLINGGGGTPFPGGVSVDVRVPPPSSPIGGGFCSSNSSTGSASEHAPTTTRNDDKSGKAKNNRCSSSTSSSSELRDMATPAPISRVQYPALHFNFNVASLQSIKAAAKPGSAAAMQTAGDSVFH